jgi:hypothetical protein
MYSLSILYLLLNHRAQNFASIPRRLRNVYSQANLEKKFTENFQNFFWIFLDFLFLKTWLAEEIC